MRLIIIALVVIAFLVGLFTYSSLPDQVASHWNSAGIVDSTLSAFWGAFLMPFVLLFVYLLYEFIPRIAPKKQRIALFRKQYDTFMLLIVLFLFAAYLFSILWNLGIQFPPHYVFIPGLSILLFYLSILCKHAKRNYFIGIRTPWTLASERVWNQTHQLASKLFMLVSAIGLLGFAFPAYSALCHPYSLCLFLLHLLPVVQYLNIEPYDLNWYGCAYQKRGACTTAQRNN